MHQAGLAKHTQMMRGGRLPHPHGARNIADRPPFTAAKAHDPLPGPIRDCLAKLQRIKFHAVNV